MSKDKNRKANAKLLYTGGLTPVAMAHLAAINEQERETSKETKKITYRKMSTDTFPRYHPTTGEFSTEPNAISLRQWIKEYKKVDPKTGNPSTNDDAIPYNTWYGRRKVHPVTGRPSTNDNAITYNTWCGKRKYRPVTGKPSTADDIIKKRANTDADVAIAPPKRRQQNPLPGPLPEVQDILKRDVGYFSPTTTPYPDTLKEKQEALKKAQHPAIKEGLDGNVFFDQHLEDPQDKGEWQKMVLYDRKDSQEKKFPFF